MRFIRALVATVSLLGSAIAVYAAPLNYDEGISGDLIGEGIITTLALDSGQNSITGQMHGISYLDASSQYQIDADLDPVQLHLPEGMRVSSIRVDTSFVDTTNNTKTAEWRWNLLAGDLIFGPLFQSSTCFVVIEPGAYCSEYSPGGGELFSGYPSTAADYLVSQGTYWAGHVLYEDAGGFLNYKLTVTVSAVPEPATAALYLFALPLLVRLSRGRRNTKT